MTASQRPTDDLGEVQDLNVHLKDPRGVPHTQYAGRAPGDDPVHLEGRLVLLELLMYHLPSEAFIVYYEAIPTAEGVLLSEGRLHKLET